MLADAVVGPSQSEEYNFIYWFKCSEMTMKQLPSIYFLVGGYWFEMKPE